MYYLRMTIKTGPSKLPQREIHSTLVASNWSEVLPHFAKGTSDSHFGLNGFILPVHPHARTKESLINQLVAAIGELTGGNNREELSLLPKAGETFRLRDLISSASLIAEHHFNELNLTLPPPNSGASPLAFKFYHANTDSDGILAACKTKHGLTPDCLIKYPEFSRDSLSSYLLLTHRSFEQFDAPDRGK